MQRALNAIEDDIFDYASTFRSKRQRSQIGKGGANTKLINVVASTSTPTPEKEKKKEGNTGNVNSNESTLLNKSSEKMKESRRENIWKTSLKVWYLTMLKFRAFRAEKIAPLC
mmetsp:Transcript_11939/g.13862  ORF Transcript_11939/g.13862 Transcript_11939/m.13862 type:complete len:113 (+) Transcript_11939:195-533(+)